MQAHSPSLPRTRTPVKRLSAENYLLYSLVAFGLTVVVTRVFLMATGYPQVGNAVLHIAHALWGGLLLFISGLLLLVLANRWAFPLSAILSGIGAGLFVDEVGKFITQANDYFFAPAAPLIYSLFLLLVLVFLLVRRSQQATPRASLHRALALLGDLLDNDLDPLKRETLLNELANGQRSNEPHLALLSEELANFLREPTIPLSIYHPDLPSRLKRVMHLLGARLGRKNHYRLIVAAVAVLGLNALLMVFSLAIAWLIPAGADEILSTILLEEAELTTQRPFWLVARLALQLVVGLTYLLALVRFARRRESAGLDLAIIASLLSLTGVHLLTFYLNQFGSLTGLFAALLLLLLMLAYRNWYLVPGSPGG